MVNKPNRLEAQLEESGSKNRLICIPQSKSDAQPRRSSLWTTKTPTDVNDCSIPISINPVQVRPSNRPLGDGHLSSLLQEDEGKDKGYYEDRERDEFSDEVFKHRLRFVGYVSKLRCQNQYAPDRSNETNEEKWFRNKTVLPERNLNCIEQLDN